MADFDRIGRNVRRMVAGGAPEAEIDSYLASEGTDAGELRYRNEVDREARRRQKEGLPGEAIDYTQATVGEMATLGAGPQIAAAGRTLFGLTGDYGRERDIIRRQIDLKRGEYGWGTLPADIAGGGAMVPARAARVATAVPGLWRQMASAAKWGAGFAGAYGFNRETRSWVDKIRSGMWHAAGGAVAGPLFHLGLTGLGRGVGRYIVRPFRRWRQARAEAAHEMERAGVRVFAPATGGATVRGAAEAGAGMLTGSSLRGAARASISDVEGRVAEEVTAAAGGRQTPAEAGEAAQGFLRRNVLERSQPKETVERLPRRRLEPIAAGTGGRLGPRQRPEDIPPVEPEYRTVSPDEVVPPQEVVTERARLLAARDRAGEEHNRLVAEYDAARQERERFREYTYERNALTRRVLRRVRRLDRDIARAEARHGNTPAAVFQREARARYLRGIERFRRPAVDGQGRPIYRDTGTPEFQAANRRMAELASAIREGRRIFDGASDDLARLDAQWLARRAEIARQRQADADREAEEAAARLTQRRREAAARNETTDGERAPTAESYPTSFDAAYELSRRDTPGGQFNVLGTRGRPAVPPRVPRPRLEGRYTPEEIDAAVAAWEDWRETRRSFSMPERLVAFVRRMGGIRDAGGDLAAMGAGETRGLINRRGTRQMRERADGQTSMLGSDDAGEVVGFGRSANGRNPDDMAQAAADAGFFLERPTVNELYAAIGEDLAGNPQVRLTDENALLAWREHLGIEQDLMRLGIHNARSARQVREILSAERVSVPRPPIPGRPAVPAEETHTTRLLEDIALEARGMLEMPGYRPGQLFGEDGSLHPGLLEYLRPRLGERITNILARYAERRATSQRPPAIEGLWNIRTLIGRSIDDAADIESRAMLQRLYDAVNRDIQTFASRVPGGEAYLARRMEINAAYRRFQEEILAPLRRLLGENVDPVSAARQLVRATERGGNIDVLKAYFRVAREKGDQLTATGWLLHNMLEDGLPGFLRAYRALSDDARRLMFAGNARGLGERLDLLARVGGRLERFARVAAPNYAVNPRRWFTPGNVSLGFLYWVNTPALLTTAAGAEVASRILASRWFARWWTRMPFERGPLSPEWSRHVARLIATATESLGLNEDAAQALKDALQTSMVAPAAAGEPERDRAPGPAPGSALAPMQRRFVALGWGRPSASPVAGKPEKSRLGRAAHDLGGMAKAVLAADPAALRRHAVAYLEGMGRSLVEDARDIARHPEDLIGPGNLTGTIIGRVGAANLARVGQDRARRALAHAMELQRRGVRTSDIVERVNRRIGETDPRLGGVVRMPDGKWGLEISNNTATFRPPPMPSGTGATPEEALVGRPVPLHQVFRNKRFYEAYPDLKDIPVYYDFRIPYSEVRVANGRLVVRLGTENSGLGTMVHEIEHLAQIVERFPFGSGPDMFEAGGKLAHLRRASETPRQAYERTAGEWLAREAEARRLMTPRSLRNDPMNFYMPRTDDLIVHYDMP